MKAMVAGSGEENNSYAIVELHDNHTITVTGYRRAISKKLERQNKMLARYVAIRPDREAQR